jgi:plasmid stabilization system protein ParE
VFRELSISRLLCVLAAAWAKNGLFSTLLAFLLGLEEQIASPEQFPESCSRIPENELLGTSYRHLLHGAYRAIFRITGSRVTILGVIHGARSVWS